MTSALFARTLMARSCAKAKSRQAVKATARYLLSKRSRVRGSSIVTSSTPRSHPSAAVDRRLAVLRVLLLLLKRAYKAQPRVFLAAYAVVVVEGGGLISGARVERSPCANDYIELLAYLLDIVRGQLHR